MSNLYKKKFWVYATPLLLSLALVVSILILSKSLPPKLPLFYSLPWGEKQLGNQQQLFIIPATVALVALFNLIISWQLHASQIFFKKILLTSSILVSLILTITFLKIIFISV